MVSLVLVLAQDAKMNYYKTDVLIVGGGPAGASTALSLLSYSDADVVLVEQSNLDQVRVGEHVSASIFDIIDYLKIKKEAFEEGSFLPAYSTTSYWGSDYPASTHSIFTTEQASFQLNRENFDFKLLETIMERGGVVLPRTKCSSFKQLDDKSWEIVVTHPEKEPFTIAAAYMVDATGRKAHVCRQLGVPVEKVDALVGIGAFLSFKDERSLPHEQLLETTELGWWYTATLPNRTVVATLFTDADLVSQYRLDKPERWNECLGETKQVKKMLNGAMATSAKPWVRSAASQFTTSTSIDNFIAVGDAAVAFDPISSMGIGFAMTSACHAAKLIQYQLAEKIAQGTVAYQEDLQKHFEQYLSIRKSFYQKEKRWATHTFWKRRNQSVEAAV